LLPLQVLFLCSFWHRTSVSLKHDGADAPDGTVKMARLPVPSVSPIDKSFVLEQSLLTKYWNYSNTKVLPSRLSDTDGTGRRTFSLSHLDRDVLSVMLFTVHHRLPPSTTPDYNVS